MSVSLVLRTLQIPIDGCVANALFGPYKPEPRSSSTDQTNKEFQTWKIDSGETNDDAGFQILTFRQTPDIGRSFG